MLAAAHSDAARATSFERWISRPLRVYGFALGSFEAPAFADEHAVALLTQPSQTGTVETQLVRIEPDGSTQALAGVSDPGPLFDRSFLQEPSIDHETTVWSWTSYTQSPGVLAFSSTVVRNDGTTSTVLVSGTESPLQPDPLRLGRPAADGGWVVFPAMGSATRILGRPPAGGLVDLVRVEGDPLLPSFRDVSLGVGAIAFVSRDSVSDTSALHARPLVAAGLDVGETWIETGDPLSASETLASLGPPQIDRSRGHGACFRGESAEDGSPGIYVAGDGSLLPVVGLPPPLRVNLTIADTETTIPGVGDPFADFDAECSFDEGRVVFAGRDAGGHAGLYQATFGWGAGVEVRIAKILASGDPLGDHRVFDLALSREGLAGHRLAFAATVGDDTPLASEIWVATLPEPDGAAAGLVAVVALGAAARRRHR